MATLTVRIIKTWNVRVTADYGDTPTSICQRAVEEFDDTAEHRTDAVILPDGIEA